MKVANIIEDGRLGGPQVRIAEVAKGLHEQRIETVVIFPRNGSEKFQKRLLYYKVKFNAIRLHRLTKEKLHLIGFIIGFFPELWMLYRYFIKNRFDIVHVSGGSWQVKGVIAGRLAGCKVVWHLNDTQMPRSIRYLFKYISNWADGFIVAGEKVKKYYINELMISQKPVHEIQAPVNCDAFDPKKVIGDAEIGKFKGIKIITVCNINQVKGVDFFIEMAAILNNKYTGLQFIIVGHHYESQKKYSEKVREMARNLNLNNLYFYGPTDNVASVLKAGDIYVCSSIREASPLSVWEAMSMEKAIVSTDVGDVARFIKDGENGFVVPIEDADTMAEKVGLLIGDEDLRKTFSYGARETAVKYLDINICVKKHAEIYDKILKNARNRPN